MKDSLAATIEEKEEIKNIILPVIYSYKEKRDKLFEEIDKEELRDKLRKIKENSINKIDELKRQAIINLTNNGIKVFEAKDQQEAAKIIKGIVGNEKTIVKSKSNTANEINLNEILKDKEIVETDLGDFVVQICEEQDVHPVLPALHLTPKKIAEVIKKRFGETVKPTPEDITIFVRNYLRNKIVNSKIGITGANAITADGSIIILENEGNISLVSRIPEKHIIISSFDKIVSSQEEALHIVKCSAIYGTGQNYPVYVNIISGPSKTSDIQNQLVIGAQGAKEVYLILLDNGRTELLKSEFKELLYCINCGACLNFCPVYHQITNRYGSKYFGARGVIFSLFSEGLKNSFDNGAFFCTTCQSCKENCPAKIDLPNLIKNLRKKLTENGIEPETITEMIKNIKEYGNPFGEIKEGKMPKELYCC